jgi:hypothetical protein
MKMILLEHKINAPVIHAYSRDDALNDGELIDITDMAAEAGFKYPTAVSRAVWSILQVPDHPKAAGETVDGRIWDMLTMLRVEIGKPSNREDWIDSVKFEFVATNEKGRKTTRKLWSKCGPGDSRAPVLTIMMQGED